MEGREEVSTMFGEGPLLMAQEASRGREATNIPGELCPLTPLSLPYLLAK